MDPENYDTDSESESEDINDEIRENCDVSQSLKNVARVLRLVSQEAEDDNDDIVIKNVKEYRRNFDGFAEIIPFDSLHSMHEYIRLNLKNQHSEEIEPLKQEIYLNILLRVKPEERFNKLLESCDPIIRRILMANRIILEDLFKIASLEKLPCPITFDSENKHEFASQTDEDDTDLNIKPWYMLEMIGIWLNFINNQQTFRDELRNELLEKCLAGISVPLKFK
ncbi:uncharacterized protein LOC122504576 isoform X2 [Leptopilina heterotoma]|nr:uncharacterized protein LOC122504576 isoform X2 [Leptopilina heterotoma]